MALLSKKSKKIKPVDQIIVGLDTMLNELRATADAQDQVQADLDKEISLLTAKKLGSLNEQKRARRIASNLDAIVYPSIEDEADVQG